MSGYTPEQVAKILVSHLGGYVGGLNAWATMSSDGNVVSATLKPQSVDAVAEQHFHAYVLPGAHDPARFLIDQGRMTCDRCGGWLVRLDEGTSLDEVLITAAAHQCNGSGGDVK